MKLFQVNGLDSMKGRTYRYFKANPLYPFGHGLSYTRFGYSKLRAPERVEVNKEIPISVDVKNIGRRLGDEVVQLYVTDLDASVSVPVRSLKGFQRVCLKPGAKKTVKFIIAPEQLSLLDKSFKRIIEPGMFEVAVGGKQPGFSGSSDATTTQVLTIQIEVINRK